ncbi:MAG: 3-hydroxyacyl-CoA dehydrogenase [Candidatus Freyarchaeum deiterrae]
MADKISRVAIIGAGTMGSDLSLEFALCDFDVVVNDISQKALDTLEKRQRQTMDELHALKSPPKESQKEYDTVKERITTTNKLEDVKDADFVLEAIKEDLNVKRKLFSYLDENLPGVVLATNTSSLRVSDIAKGLEGADRIALMHFSNPLIISRLAEIMKGEETSEETLETISRLAERIGKTPVVLRKDMNGAVMNRILVSINNDGLMALDKGEATQKEIDASFFRAIGFILGMTGTIDVVGLDVAVDVGRYLGRAYGKRLVPSVGVVLENVKAGRLGKKSGIGFNDWSKGPPVADKKLASRYDDNRIFAMGANEAFWVMKDQMADPKTIDTILKGGFRLRTGICESADSIGLDKLSEILKGLYAKYELEMYETCPLFDEYVKKGWTGKAAGRGFYTYPIES